MCGATRVDAAWKPRPREWLQRAKAVVVLVPIGTLLAAAGLGNAQNMLVNELHASAGRWIGVSLAVLLFLAGAAACYGIASLAAFAREHEVLTPEGTIRGVVVTLFGRASGAGVMHFEGFQAAAASGVSSADVIAAGPAAVAACTGGRIVDANTAVMFGALMGLVSHGAASVSVATMRTWSKRFAWSRVQRRGPLRTLMIRRVGASDAGLPPLERSMFQALQSLGEYLAPQRDFELVDVLHESAKHPSASGASAQNAEGAEVVGQRMSAFFDALDGRTLQFSDLPSEIAHLLSIVDA